MWTDWTTGRSPLSDDGDYPHPACAHLNTGLYLLAHFVEETLDQEGRGQEEPYGNDVFAMRPTLAEMDLPNFSYGPPGAPHAFDVAWDTEPGDHPTVSRPLTTAEVSAAVTAALASLPVELPERMDHLYVNGEHAGADYIAHLLATARATASATQAA
jgi:hypothetical protein